jgi:competence protein ComEA
VRACNAETSTGGSSLERGAAASPTRITARPWFAVALRVLGIALLMAGLGAVGAVSILSGVTRGELLDESTATRADVAAAWVAVNRAAEASTKHTTTTPAAPKASAAAKQQPKRSAGITKDGKVVLNRATAEELTRLPGIGEKRAAAIVALRERLGRFKRSSDLLRVRGIGPVSLHKMKPHFVLDSPKEPKVKGDKKRKKRKKPAK